jgi:mRNA interferase MazF
MEKFVKRRCGFTKRRPAFVLAELDGDDRILCQITSQQFMDRYAVSVDESDFEEGSLRKASNVRPNRIFTADIKIILYKAGHLKSDKINIILKEVINILAD